MRLERDAQSPKSPQIPIFETLCSQTKSKSPCISDIVSKAVSTHMELPIEKDLNGRKLEI